MADITKEFLVNNGFKKEYGEYENIFTYINKEYTIEVGHRKIPFHNKWWEILIYSPTRSILGDVLVQTTEQFKMIMDLYDVDLNITINSEIYTF